MNTSQTKTENVLSNCTACWISLFMRVSIIIYLGISGLRKTTGGIAKSVEGLKEMYAETGVPEWLVVFQGYTVPWLEVIIGIWLIIGFKLRGAFITSALLMLNFAGAMKILGKGDVVQANCFFVLLCCVGLSFCRHDCASMDWFLKKNQLHKNEL